MKILTKMSLATLGANPSRVKEMKDGKPVHSSIDLVRIYGVASSLVFKTDPKTGDIQVAVAGNFEAVNLENRETYRAGILWLPGGIQELLINSVDTGQVDGNGKPIYQDVKFGFTIAAVPASNPIGYSYTAEQLIDAQQNDPLAELRASLPELAALPAPDAAKK